MKIEITSSSHPDYPGFWYINAPFESPDYFAPNRAIEAIEIILEHRRMFYRHDLFEDGSSKTYSWRRPYR